MVEPTKVCADCKQRKPWSSFYAKKKWPDGTMRQPAAYCKPCHQARTNEWERQRAASDPDWRRRRGKRNRELLKADPEKYSTSLAYRRDWARRKYGYRRDLHRVQRSKALVPAAPFADYARWTQERDGCTIIDLAARFGCMERTLREILKGRTESVEITTVERALINDDAPVTFEDLYREAA